MSACDYPHLADEIGTEARTDFSVTFQLVWDKAWILLEAPALPGRIAPVNFGGRVGFRSLLCLLFGKLLSYVGCWSYW